MNGSIAPVVVKCYQPVNAIRLPLPLFLQRLKFRFVTTLKARDQKSVGQTTLIALLYFFKFLLHIYHVFNVDL
jgi:hypothetical protein